MGAESELKMIDIKIDIKERELEEARARRAELIAEILLPYLVSYESEG